MKLSRFVCLLSILPTFLLVGCKEQTPKCSDESTKSVIHQLLEGRWKSYNGSDATYDIENIRTLGYNESTGIRQCAADVGYTVYPKQANSKPFSHRKPVTYTVQITDNGKSIYVNMMGLR